MESFNFHNHQHYGDCLTSLHFLIKLSKTNKIRCNFSCNNSYHGQLKELIPGDCEVYLFSHGMENSIDLWGAKLLHKVQDKYGSSYPLYCQNFPQYEDVFSMVFEMWKCLCEDLGLIFPFTDKKEIFFDEDTLEITPKKSYDWLLINSYCLSGQIKYSNEDQDNLFIEIIDKLLEKNKTFITTKKIKNYPSTEDDNMSLVQIGQLSKNCKVIMGVPTSPFWISINKWSFEGCEKFINFTHDSCTFDMENKFFTVNSLTQVLEHITSN